MGYKSVILLQEIILDGHTFTPNKVATLPVDIADKLIKDGKAEGYMDHIDKTDSQPVTDLCKPDPVPPIPENLPPARKPRKAAQGVDYAMGDDSHEYVVLGRDIWIQRNGKSVRCTAGDVVTMLPEIAAPLLAKNLIRDRGLA